jgi:hypothetical protein
LDIKVTGVRTNDAQRSKSKLSCTANLEITIPADSIKVVNNRTFKDAASSDNAFRSMTIEGNIARGQITYTSQLADNGKEFFVEIKGSDGMQGVIQMIAFWQLQYRKEQRDNPAAANSSAAPSPAPAESVVAPPAKVDSGEAVVKAAAANLETKSAATVASDEKDSPPIVANLCTSSETVLFACTTGKKLISVCGTKGLSASAGNDLSGRRSAAKNGFQAG